MNISLNLLRCAAKFQLQQKEEEESSRWWWWWWWWKQSVSIWSYCCARIFCSYRIAPRDAGPDVASSHWCSVRRLDSRGPAALSSDVAGRSPLARVSGEVCSGRRRALHWLFLCAAAAAGDVLACCASLVLLRCWKHASCGCIQLRRHFLALDTSWRWCVQCVETSLQNNITKWQWETLMRCSLV